MKLAIFITFALASHAFAGTKAQEITLNVKNAPLREVMKEIQKQEGYSFLFRGDEIADMRVNVRLKDAVFAEAMRIILEERGLDWSLDEGIITIRTKPNQVNRQVGSTLQRVVTGKVTDEEGAAVEGVTVAVKGTASAVATDGMGEYRIVIPEYGSTLVFTIVGFEAVAVPIGQSSTVNVVLKGSVSDLNEVIVVGYGTSKSRNIINAVANISGESIAERKVPQISHALQGAVPGVRVTRANGSDPSQDATIRIRGNTTLGNNNPLVIIDGVPGDLNTISPNDVADITVLKDAAAASIYGSRGAAGVILVTTLRGQLGESTFDYGYEFGLQSLAASPQYARPVEYMSIYNEAMRNDGDTPIWPEEVIRDFENLNKLYPDSFPSTDWQDVLFSNVAPIHNHTFVFSTGTEKIKTKASFNYTQTDGLYTNKSYERYNIRVNNDFRINSALSASFDLSFSRSRNSNPQAGKELEPISEARYIPPTDDYIYDDGRWAPGRTGMNVIATVNDGGFRRNIGNDLGGRLALNLTPLEGLSFTAMVSPQLGFDKNTSFLTPISYTDRLDPSLVIYITKPNPVLDEERPASFFINGQLLANYHKELMDNDELEVMFGYEESYTNYEAFGAGRTGGFILSNPYLDLGSTSLRTNFGSFTETSLRSVFSRIGYNINNKYLFQFNGRYDASSRFHKDHRWGFFPSLSVGWILSDEAFMGSIKGHISFLKLRASWGAVGNERIGDYPYQSAIDFGNSLFYSAGQIIPLTTGSQSDYALENISWEKTETRGIGFDAAMLTNRLRVSADYFNKLTNDILLTLDIPRYFGYSAPAQNAGKVTSKGWELNVNWRDKVGSLNYDIGINLSDDKTKIVDLKGTQILGNTAQLEGEEFSSWYGYLSEGLFQTAEEVANSAKLSNTIKPGDVKFIDVNGDGRISAESDKVPLGGSLPRYIYGGNVKLDYKGFDLLVVLQGVGKTLSYLQSYQVQPLRGNYGSVPTTIFGKYWKQDNSAQENLEASYPRVTRTYSSNSYQMSDFWLIDGSYFRLKNVTLGYNIDDKVISKLKLKRAKIYCSANDLLSLSEFPKGWDPEVSATSYPMLRTFMIGINVTF